MPRVCACCLWGSLTQTLDAIADPTVPTATLEAAGNVDAGGVHGAVVSPDFTLVHVWTKAKTSHSRGIQNAPIGRQTQPAPACCVCPCVPVQPVEPLFTK